MGKGAAPLNFSAGVLRLDDTAYRRIPARLTTVASTTVTTGVTQYRYGFVEQIFNPTTGIYTDRYDGLKGDGQYTYATELNNQAFTGPFAGTAAVTTGGVGPFVWLRNKAQINGGAVYEFDNGNQYLVRNIGSNFNLSTSWSDVGFVLTLPSYSTWLLLAQVNGQLTSDSAGAGDSISCRFYDGTSTAGQCVEFCNAVCSSLTFTDAASITTVYATTINTVTVNLQGVINTGSSSSAVVIAGDTQAGSAVIGVRLF